MVSDEFEWDDDKAESNRAKHGVTFEEATSIFRYDPGMREAFDPDHSDDEDRFLAVGWSETGKLLIVSFTDREQRLRIISARQLERWEEKEYVRGDFP